MKQYVFRRSSTTPDEVIEYLEEKTKTMSFPKLVESLVLQDIAKPEEEAASKAASAEAINELKSSIEEQGKAIAALTESVKDGAADPSIADSIKPLFKKLDDNEARRFAELRQEIADATASDTPVSVDVKEIKRNVYLAVMSALKKREEETGFQGLVLKGISDTQELFIMQLGTTIGEQVDALEDIRSDIDSLISYLSAPGTDFAKPALAAPTQADEEDIDDIIALLEEDEMEPPGTVEVLDVEVVEEDVYYDEELIDALLLLDDDEEEEEDELDEADEDEELAALAAVLHGELDHLPVLSEVPDEEEEDAEPVPMGPEPAEAPREPGTFADELDDEVVDLLADMLDL